MISLKPIPPNIIRCDREIVELNKIMNPVVLVTIVGLIFYARSKGTKIIPPPTPIIPANIPAIKEEKLRFKVDFGVIRYSSLWNLYPILIYKASFLFRRETTILTNPMQIRNIIMLTTQ